MSSVQRETARRVNTNVLENHDRKKRPCSPMIMIAIKVLHPIEPISWLQRASAYEAYCRPNVNFLSLLYLFKKHTHEKDQSPVTPNPFPAPTPKNPASSPATMPQLPTASQPSSPHRRTRLLHTPPSHRVSAQSPTTPPAPLQFH